MTSTQQVNWIDSLQLAGSSIVMKVTHVIVSEVVIESVIYILNQFHVIEISGN
jgi:hypothetical protein